MDRLRDMAGNAGSIRELLEGIEFPISKDNLLDQIQQRGAPEQVVNRLRDVDTSQFDSAQEVLAKAQGVGS